MIQFKLKPCSSGYQAQVWEPAPTTVDRLKPYLWKVQRIVATEAEAIELLRQYEQS